ncbi:MAG TPA: PAS domain S-box protein [Gillisia sp.]|nr:PAS domain S-box protein [Gillisia sp.]
MHKNLRILHLEDEPSDALLVSHALKQAGFKFDCMVVDTEEEFLTALKDFDPELILADHSLPSFNSFEALELLGSMENKIPVILVTAAMSDEFAVNAIKRGAKDYVLKDRLGRLPSAIKNVLETQRLERERDGFILQLERNERKFRKLIENGADAVVVLAPDGTPSYVTPSLKRVLGYSEKEALELNIYEIIHENHRECVLEKLKECQANPQIPFDENTVRARHKDGSWRWLEVTLTCFMEDSAIEGIVADFRDVTERKLSEKALKESEEKYRSFFENSLDGILLTAPDGRIFAANASACQMFQRTEEEICEVGRSGVVDLCDPRAALAIKERDIIGKVLTEINMVRKDGSIFPASLSSAIFENAIGEKQTSTIIRDISETKRAEQELIKSEHEYRKLFQNNPLPNIIYDKDTLKILDVNQAALDHYGFTHDEILEVNLLDFVPQEEIPDIKKAISNLPVSGGEVMQNNLTIFRKNGERIKVETFGYGLQYQERNCRLIICLDITEKEAALQKLKDKTEKLLTAQRIAKLGYWTHNLENDNIFWSDQVFNIWERDSSSFQPNLISFEATMHPADFPAFNEARALAINGKKDLDFEHRIILPDGKIKWVHEMGKVIKTGNQKPVFEGTVQDITERRNSLEKLVKSEARFRGLIQSQTNYVIRTDIQGRYTYGNQKFIDDFGWVHGEKEILGQDSMATIKEYHHNRVQEAVEKCLANPDQVFQLEIDKPAKGGGVKTTLWDLIYLKGTAFEPDEIQCVGIDITDRVQAEEGLKESNIRYELVSKATSDAIYDWDLNSNVLFWGDAFYEMFGYSQMEFSTTMEAYMDKIHPEEKSQITQSLILGVEGRDNHWKAEYRLKKADGKYAFVIEKGFILRDDNGKAFRMVGAIQDVTEKKKLEELLDEASRFARIGSFEIDCEKDTMYWSPVTKEIHGVDLDYEPNLEKGILFYKEGKSRNAMSNAYLNAQEENIPYDLEMQIITAKGKERWIRKIGRPTFVDGKCVRINGSFQDITNIKNSEITALKASEEKEIILESIGDAFFMVDNDWKVTYWNRHSEKLLECARKEILGKNLWDVFPDAIDTKFYTSYQKAVTEKSIEDFEEYFERLHKWFEVTAYPSNSGLSVYFKDVTERKVSELEIVELNKNLKSHTDELVEANKGLEQFSFIVSHNLRSPVANIIGLADLISNKDYPEEVKTKFIKALLDNVKRLDVVISDLNSILQVKVEMDAKKEPVQLKNLVDSIKISVHNLIEKEKVEITTNFDVSSIHTVQSYLHSIFYNLIANSIKYRRPGIPPRIEIRSQFQDGTINITFEDNGLGIDLNKKGDQVFGLYRRFHHHIEGKGMGLFLVKTQVELLGGKISIESEVNSGTKFTITFNENTIY